MQPKTKMSSCQAPFDLKAARDICSRIKGYEDPDGGNFADFEAAMMLPAALDRIDQLQATIETLKAALVFERESRMAGSKKSKCYPHIGNWARFDKYSHKEALDQLARELPEIFGKDVK